MRKIYDKNELRFALLWIAIYVVAFSVSDDVSVSLGIAKSVTAPFSVLMTIIIYMWIKKNGLKEKYGLCGLKGSEKEYLYSTSNSGDYKYMVGIFV